MATTRTSGRSADLSESDEIIKTARTFIVLLRKDKLPSASKAELADFLEKVIKSRQQVTNRNQPGTTTSEADVVASQLNAVNQKLDELKAIATTNSAKVDELKTTITASNERTYAQVAAAAVATPNPSARIMKRQQAEQAKRERAKFQFTLSTKFMSEDAKKELGLQHPKEITARCQHAMDQVNLASKPKVQAINPPKNGQLRLQFKTTEETQELHDVNWSEAYEGLKANKPKYGVVIHGVAKSAIDLTTNHDETIKEWERDNESKGIKIVKVIPLRRERSGQETAGKHRSIVVFTHDPVSADHCIRYGLFIDKLCHKTAKYAPQHFLTQCYKCHEFGHRAMSCKRQTEICGKCASGDHTTANCTSTVLKCVNCKERPDDESKHEAWHVECPARKKENEDLANIKRAAWAFFTDTYQ